VVVRACIFFSKIAFRTLQAGVEVWGDQSSDHSCSGTGFCSFVFVVPVLSSWIHPPQEKNKLKIKNKSFILWGPLFALVRYDDHHAGHPKQNTHNRHNGRNDLGWWWVGARRKLNVE